MRFERLRDEVVAAERRMETRQLRARTSWRALGAVWSQAWSPGRILVVGLVGGFLFARARPLGKFGGVPATRWIQMATSLSGLVASLRAQMAAQSAQTAADDAGEAADEAADTAEEAAGTVQAATGTAAGAATGAAAAASEAGAAPDPDPPRPSVSDARRRPDTPLSGEPRPAEAATELSER